MPIVTDSILSGLRTGFNAAYKRGAGRAPGHWQKVATRIPSTNASNTYGWLGQFPKLTEWVGDRAVKDMKEHGYVVTNKLYEGTVGVKRTDIEDDNLGIYAPMFEEMGYAAATHPDELVFSLLGKGFSTNCYDGQFFFDKDHPVAVNVDGTGGNATVSNLIDAAASPESKAPWYLLDVSRTLKAADLPGAHQPGTASHHGRQKRHCVHERPVPLRRALPLQRGLRLLAAGRGRA